MYKQLHRNKKRVFLLNFYWNKDVLDFDEEIKKLTVKKLGFVETMPILCSGKSFCEQQDEFFLLYLY